MECNSSRQQDLMNVAVKGRSVRNMLGQHLREHEVELLEMRNIRADVRSHLAILRRGLVQLRLRNIQYGAIKAVRTDVVNRQLRVGAGADFTNAANLVLLNELFEPVIVSFPGIGVMAKRDVRTQCLFRLT